MRKSLFVLVIFAAAIFIRFIKLSDIPPGLYLDEASLGYNSYSLILTGKDEYGKTWPVFFRSFATFQSPLYVYLSAIPIKVLGLSIFSTRLVSAVTGVILLIISFFLIKNSNLNKRWEIAVLTLITISFSPWSIFISRAALEAQLGLVLFVASLFLIALSLKRAWLFIFAAVLMSCSAYAYHGERLLGTVFLLSTLFLFRHYFKKHKRIAAIAVFLFIIIQAPQLFLLTSPGSLRRLNTQGYFQKSTFEKFGGSLTKVPFGRELYIGRQFTSQYLSSYSPRSLFFEPEPQTFRSIPNLSVFYFWMIIPFILGISHIWKNRHDPTIKLIILVIIFGPLAAALVGDPFYTLRMLPMLWGMSIMIAFGIKSMLDKFKHRPLKITLSVILLILSGFIFYLSYFVLLRTERSYAYGYPYMELAKKTEELKDINFVLDTEIYDAPYILMAFYKKINPVYLQEQSDPQLLKEYYTNLEFNKYRKIGNVDIRHIRWDVDQCLEEIIVADEETLSESQALDHAFTLSFEFKDLLEKTILRGYKTNPQIKCKESKKTI